MAEVYLQSNYTKKGVYRYEETEQKGFYKDYRSLLVQVYDQSV